MTWTLALDPGRAGFGWAAYEHVLPLRQDAKLRACGVVPQPKGKRDFEPAALQDVAAKVEQAVRNAMPCGDFPRWGSRAVVERMVYYPGRKAFAANDLLDLQAIGGLVAAALVPLTGIVYCRPAEWKGSVDTAVIQRRLVELPPASTHNPLDPLEHEILRAAVTRAGKTLGHNIVDAVSLGLVEVGRLRLR